VAAPKNQLYQVQAPTFAAGLVVSPQGVILRCAPILRGWRGRPVADLQAWCEAGASRRYRLVLVGDDPYPAAG